MFPTLRLWGVTQPKVESDAVDLHGISFGVVINPPIALHLEVASMSKLAPFLRYFSL